MNQAPVPGRQRVEELTRMMETYGNMLCGLCTGLLNDRELAQDMVQETFLRAWKRMDTLRGGSQSEKAWLCRIAVNLCRDYQRTRWFRLVDRDEEAIARIAAPSGEEAAAVWDSVCALPMRLREVILLHYYQNMDAESMAQTLGLTVSAVYRRLRKAREKLGLLLKGEDVDD